MHYHERMIDARGNLLVRRQRNSSALDQAWLKSWAEAFPGWGSVSMPFRLKGLGSSGSSPGVLVFSRSTRSAALLTFSVDEVAILSSALLSGENDREDFEAFRDLIDWTAENRHMIYELDAIKFDPLRVKDRPLIASILWHEGLFADSGINLMNEYLALAFFSWARRKT